jgi:phosphoglycerate kinase
VPARGGGSSPGADLPQLEDLPPVAGRSVLVRCDFNVTLRRGRIVNDLRIRAATPTLEWLVRRGARVTVCTHLGRPGGRRDPRYDLAPVRARLAELVPGVNLMENLRFHAGEEANDPAFVDQLVEGQDHYVNDAFAAAHRRHASVVGPPGRLPSAAGRLLSREVAVLGALRSRARRPFLALLGGPPDPERLRGVGRLLDFVDQVVLGGPLAYAAMAAGTASAEALADLGRAVRAGRVVLPPDVVLVRSDDPAQVKVGSAVPPGWQAVDIGHRSSARFAALVAAAGTVFWDGAMSGGEYIRGTRAVAEAVAGARGFSVVSGADSLAALERLQLSAFVNHLSTGGAAALELLHDGDLPGLEALRAPRAGRRAHPEPPTPPVG